MRDYRLSFYGGRCFWYTVLLLVIFLSISESDKEEKPQSTVIPKEVTPALCSLMSSYGSLSGSESEPEGKSQHQLLHVGLFCFVTFACDTWCASVASIHVYVFEERYVMHILYLILKFLFHLIQK